jgi:type II secretion system protein C
MLRRTLNLRNTFGLVAKSPNPCYGKACEKNKLGQCCPNGLIHSSGVTKSEQRFEDCSRTSAFFGLNVLVGMLKLALAPIVYLLCSSVLMGASADQYLVLGVIASSKDQVGVALLKDKQTSRTFAIREGQKLGASMTIGDVRRRTVEVVINQSRYVLKVGDELSEAIESSAPRVDLDYAAHADTQLHRQGDTVAVAREFKDHLIKDNLGKILMQAAAVPNMVDGRLSGFQIWDIEPKSIFDLAGLKDGDVVVAVNGLEINNVGSTIKQLNSLKEANEASFSFVRNGIQQNLRIVVQ